MATSSSGTAISCIGELTLLTQSGQTVSVANSPYNATIPAGGNTALGFQAAYTGTNARPGVITLNGKACTIQ